MKKSQIWSIALAFVLSIGLMTSCQEESAKQEDTVTKLVFTKAVDTEVEKLYVNTPFEKQEVAFEGNEATVAINTSGLTTVSYRADRGEGGRLIAMDGGSYSIAVDTASKATLTDPSAEQTAYTQGREVINKALENFTELVKKEEGEYMMKMKGLQKTLKDHFATAAGDKAVLQYANQELEYAVAGRVDMYQGYHGYYAEKEDFETSADYKAYAASFDHVSGPKGSMAYADYLSSHYQNLVTEEDQDYNEAMLAGARAEKDPAFAAYAEAMVFKGMLQYEDEGEYTDQIEALLTKLDYAPLKAGLIAGRAKWAPIVKGQVAPTFAYNDLEGNEVKLEDFKGKYVYIDVWATWCGPCKYEAPYFEELADKYKNNEEIVFMGVSIDQDKAAWEKMVKEKDIQGVQLIADKAWASSIAKDYLINGIPRFLLIGKDGKIVDATAPRPSSDILAELLGDLVGA